VRFQSARLGTRIACDAANRHQTRLRRDGLGRGCGIGIGASFGVSCDLPLKSSSLVLGAHLILSAYGFWLPNDPRGSWSDSVGSWELFRFGPATKVHTRASVAHVPHNRALRIAARKAIDFPCVRFSGKQAQAIGHGFAKATRESSYIIHACSILPTHAHLVIRYHPAKTFEQIAGHLKTSATWCLRERGLDPMEGFSKPDGKRPSAWGRKTWKVYIHTEAHYRAAVKYVIQNPQKEGKPQQRWSFVVPLDQAPSKMHTP